MSEGDLLARVLWAIGVDDSEELEPVMSDALRSEINGVRAEAGIALAVLDPVMALRLIPIALKQETNRHVRNRLKEALTKAVENIDDRI